MYVVHFHLGNMPFSSQKRRFCCFEAKDQGGKEVGHCHQARLAQSVERTTLNRVVVGSSPTVGDLFSSTTLSAPLSTRLSTAHLIHHSFFPAFGALCIF